jgi:hypothetical protein
MRKYARLLAVAGMALATPAPAHAAATVTIGVAPTRSYSACATVNGPSSVWFTVGFSTTGVQSAGLAAAEVSDANTGSGYGTVRVCNLGGILPTYGAVVYSVTYTTLKGSTGALVVECTTINAIFACTPTSAPSVAALD